MMKAAQYNKLFDEVIKNYHVIDDVDQVFENPFDPTSFEHLLYRKNWIDTVQWHYEDIIRLPNINPAEALVLKRKIDASNQDRTDMVEYIDSYFLDKFKNVKVKEGAKINSETPAWAIDRLSYFSLKNLPYGRRSHTQNGFRRTQSEMSGQIERFIGTKS